MQLSLVLRSEIQRYDGGFLFRSHSVKVSEIIEWSALMELR